jgi:[acyl-carrier-protein] S-malonyltransferase
MCRDLWRVPEARRALERLSAVMGEDLERVTTEMPSAELSLTFNAQRAIHAHHVGHWLAFRAAHPKVLLGGALGHSVGIVAALVATGALSVEDSGIFVLARARAFSEACAALPRPAGLAALSTENLDDAIDELASFPRLSLALRNSVGKGAVGGPIEDLQAFADKARSQGWPLRVQLLPVEGPYHTAAYASCRERLAPVLGRLSIRRPEAPVFFGTSGQGESDPGRIRELLAAQPSTPEMHLDAVRASYAAGCRAYLEVAAKPQPIRWLSDQLVDESGAPLPGVTATAVETANLSEPR